MASRLDKLLDNAGVIAKISAWPTTNILERFALRSAARATALIKKDGDRAYTALRDWGKAIRIMDDFVLVLVKRSLEKLADEIAWEVNIERDAFLDVFGVAKFVEKTTHDKYLYHEMTLQDEKSVSFVIRVFLGSKMGGVSTAQRTTAILQEFAPHFIMMTGVCGRRRGEVQLGDLLVADRVFALQGKQYADSREALDLYVGELRDQLLGFVRQLERLVPTMTACVPRPFSKQFQLDSLLASINKAGKDGLTGAELKQAAVAVGIDNDIAYKSILDELREKKQWIELNKETKRFVLTKIGRDYIDDYEIDGLTFPPPFPSKPKQYVGPILVSPTHVRSDMTKEKWAEIAKFERKVLGVEMEGSDAVRTFNENRKDGKRTEVLFVKGVMDFADPDKDDGFKQYAAELAAEWARMFIVKYASMAIG